MFPLNHWMREAPVQAAMLISDYLSPALVIKEIDTALKGDPWAPGLIYDRAVLVAREAAVHNPPAIKDR